jgi:lysophospholipase
MPPLAERFLAPPGFVWGGFATGDGAVLRWGHLAAENPRAQCVLVGGFGDFIEKQFETIRDLAARGSRCGASTGAARAAQLGRSAWPQRPRARRFDRDAAELAQFAAAKLQADLPHVLIAHSMGGAIALLCLHNQPDLFDAAILSAPMLGLLTGKAPPTLLRAVTGPARLAGLGACPAARAPIAGTPTGRRRQSAAAFRAMPSDAASAMPGSSSEPGLRLDQPTYGWLDPALG